MAHNVSCLQVNSSYERLLSLLVLLLPHMRRQMSLSIRQLLPIVVQIVSADKDVRGVSV